MLFVLFRFFLLAGLFCFSELQLRLRLPFDPGAAVSASACLPREGEHTGVTASPRKEVFALELELEFELELELELLLLLSV